MDADKIVSHTYSFEMYEFLTFVFMKMVLDSGKIVRSDLHLFEHWDTDGLMD